MKRLLVACFLLAACVAPGRKERFVQERFVKLDQGVEASPRTGLTRVFVNADEMVKEKAPPYQFVGVVEVENIQTEQLSIFYERVADAGAKAGCEAMLQRDAYKGTVPSPSPVGAKPSSQKNGSTASVASPGAGSFTAGGGGAYHNDMAIWQFLCGVGGATQDQAEVSFKQADELAVKMRVASLGFEPCAPFTPLGSHIRKTRVCLDDPKGRNRPDSTSFER